MGERGDLLAGSAGVEFCAAQGFHDFAFDLFPALIRAGGRVLGVRSDALVIDIGSHEAARRGKCAGRERRLAPPRAA